MLLLRARLLVFAIFLVLGASFLATTGVLAWEFGRDVWLDFATSDSHLFVFFPTLGVAALFAFYVPACVFVDLYWRHVKWGKLRFFAGFVVLAAASYAIAAGILSGENRSMWEVAPAALQADRGEPAACSAKAGGVCQRLPMLQALRNLRLVSRDRLGVGDFVRDCTVADQDPLLGPSQQSETKRFCFASTLLSTPPLLQSDADCCKAQARLGATVRAHYADPRQRSLTAAVHAALLPLKAFFLLVVLAISLLLAIHHKNVEKHYGAAMTRIEIGLMVGSLCMLLFPLMSQAFVQSAAALYGSYGRGPFVTIMPLVSFFYMVWALMIGLFFYRRKANDTLLSVGRLGGLIASNVGMIKYNFLIAFVAWAFGAGASELGLTALATGSAIIALLTVFTTRARKSKHQSEA